MKPTLIITVITDTILFVTMLIGLFRLLTGSSSTFGLARLLWKQVGRHVPPLRALKPLTLFSILKGIIWLLIATVAGIPPTASFASFPVHVRSHRHMNEPGTSGKLEKYLDGLNAT